MLPPSMPVEPAPVPVVPPEADIVVSGVGVLLDDEPDGGVGRTGSSGKPREGHSAFSMRPLRDEGRRERKTVEHG